MTGRIKSLVALLLCITAVAGCGRTGVRNPATAQEPGIDPAEVRFRSLAIELEVGEQEVAGYQIELKTIAGDALIVGVGGGTARGFTDPPTYDPAALAGGRIILAAMNPNLALNMGRHLVAVVHMRESGEEPVYEVEVIAAGDVDGRVVPVTAVLLDDEDHPTMENE
jgi:hypothetical protein